MPISTLPMSYCGPPPLPENLWERWNFDPVLLAAMAMVIAAFLWLRRDATPRERWSFGLGLATLAIIFISPLCALTVALFSARVVHHVLLVAIAAPLLALAVVSTVRSHSIDRLLGPLVLLHTATFWLWHAPDAYTAALSSTPIYWLMQITLLGTATALWTAIFAAPAGRAIAALLALTVQMGLLGALLVFSGQPLYLPHLTTTIGFGLDPHADQQLAGLIMWVPASLPYIGVALMRLIAWLSRSEATQS